MPSTEEERQERSKAIQLLAAKWAKSHDTKTKALIIKKTNPGVKNRKRVTLPLPNKKLPL